LALGGGLDVTFVRAMTNMTKEAKKQEKKKVRVQQEENPKP